MEMKVVTFYDIRIFLDYTCIELQQNENIYLL